MLDLLDSDNSPVQRKGIDVRGAMGAEPEEQGGEGGANCRREARGVHADGASSTSIAGSYSLAQPRSGRQQPRSKIRDRPGREQNRFVCFRFIVQRRQVFHPPSCCASG